MVHRHHIGPSPTARVRSRASTLLRFNLSIQELLQDLGRRDKRERDMRGNGPRSLIFDLPSQQHSLLILFVAFLIVWTAVLVEQFYANEGEMAV